MADVVLPQEVDMEKVGRGGIALVHFTFSYDHWEFRLEIGADKGRDCTFEYIDEDNRWPNARIECQVKGTKKLESYKLKNENCFSYYIERKTINYALRSNNAFILLLGDLVHNKVYYLSIQDYFIEDESRYETLESKNDGGMMLHIPIENMVTNDDDSALVELAKCTYSFKKGRVHKEKNDG